MARTVMGFKNVHRFFGRGKPCVVVQEGNSLPGDISCFTGLLSTTVEVYNTGNIKDLQQLQTAAEEILDTARRREKLRRLMHGSPRLHMSPEWYQELDKEYRSLGGEVGDQGMVC